MLVFKLCIVLTEKKLSLLCRCSLLFLAQDSVWYDKGNYRHINFILKFVQYLVTVVNSVKVLTVFADSVL